MFRIGPQVQADLPVSIETESGQPVHVVHSDPRQLAYLVGLIALQTWTHGIDEIGVPVEDRRPILVITDKPGHFGESYLQLYLPADTIPKVFRRHRVIVGMRGGRISGTSSYLDHKLGPDDQRTRLHNFFPAAQIASGESVPRMIEDREFLGRGDEDCPAVLITRKFDTATLEALTRRFAPILVVVDAAPIATTLSTISIPTVIYHESIFAPEFLRKSGEAIVPVCLPDSQFERFCSGAELNWVEPAMSSELQKSWEDLDSAFQVLMERLDVRRDRVLADAYRTTARLRNLLLCLPVGIKSYEQGLMATAHPSIAFDWSISERLNAISAKVPEVAALGEWEKVIIDELVAGFGRLETLLRDSSPKHQGLIASIQRSRSEGKRAIVIAASSTVGAALEWALQLPEPRGLGTCEGVSIITPAEICNLSDESCCIIHQVFEPYVIFAPLARVAPKRITFVLLPNELRFVGEHFLRSRLLFPEHVANRTILAPVFHRLEQLPSPKAFTPGRKTALFPEAEFELLRRMFTQSSSVLDRGTVLLDEPDKGDLVLTEVATNLVRLEGDCAVLLEPSSRISYVDGDGAIRTGHCAELVTGDRLIIINPDARESIAHRILRSRRDEEWDKEALEAIATWRAELESGVKRLRLTHSEVLARIQARGSERITPPVIGQWIRGDVLGPLDPADIRRLGEVLGSEWLSSNWQRVSLALIVVRSGHRLLGRQITKLIQQAAAGDFKLNVRDEEFLKQVGITMAELQDSVTLLKVEAVHPERVLAPVHQVGRVMPT
ncbi:MAG: DrmE family protein [Terriglobia bacterium]